MPDIDTYGPERVDAQNAPAFALMPFVYRMVGGVTFTIGDESSDVITVTIQMRDIRGRKLIRRTIVDVIFSTSSFGVPNAVIEAITATTGNIIREGITRSVITVETNASGLLVLSVVDTGATDYYVRVVGPNVLEESSTQLDYT